MSTLSSRRSERPADYAGLGHAKPDTTIRYTQLGDHALRDATVHLGGWIN